MDLQLVRSFVEVARSGTFAAASERLFVTQSAVSLRIQRLEEALGRALFQRSSEGVRLNAAGEVFRGYAEDMLALWEGARHAVLAPDAGGVPNFRVVGEASLWDWPMQPCLTELGGLLSAGRLSGDVTGGAAEVASAVAGGEAHLGFATADVAVRGVVCERVAFQPLIFVASVAGYSANALPPVLIHAAWSESFLRFHDLAFPSARPTFSVPPAQVESLLYSVERAGAWLPERRAAPALARGQLHKVAQAPVFSQPIYALRRHDAEMSLVSVMQKALNALQVSPLPRLDGAPSAPPAFEVLEAP